MTKKYARVIEVPGIDEDEKAYDHDRPISGLIRSQLHHLQSVEHSKLKERDRTGININDLDTEGKAASYIKKVTALLHPKGAAAKSKPGRAAGKARPAAKKRK